MATIAAGLALYGLLSGRSPRVRVGAAIAFGIAIAALAWLYVVSNAAGTQPSDDSAGAARALAWLLAALAVAGGTVTVVARDPSRALRGFTGSVAAGSGLLLLLGWILPALALVLIAGGGLLPLWLRRRPTGEQAQASLREPLLACVAAGALLFGLLDVILAQPRAVVSPAPLGPRTVSPRELATALFGDYPLAAGGVAVLMFLGLAGVALIARPPVVEDPRRERQAGAGGETAPPHHV